MAVRIAIFESDIDLRNLLKFFLQESDDYEVMGSYGDLTDVEGIVLRDRPDFLIMDTNLPDRDFLPCISLARALHPGIHVLIYTGSADPETIKECLYAGAEGYILKKSPLSSLLAAIREVRSGGAYFSPEVAKKILLTLLQKPRPSEAISYDLTGREAQVLKLLMKGHSVKGIAVELNMAFETCRTHLRSVYKKLNVNCGKEAIVKILQEK